MDSVLEIIPLIDLTSLNDDDSEESITTLCANAITPFGSVAAVCVYSKFVPLAVELLKNSSVNIATVVNFPQGESNLTEILDEIKYALHLKANEIDLVFPYRAYLKGDTGNALKVVAEARAICPPSIKLKIIIETGELFSLDIIKMISAELIALGVDFIKTSTGKVERGASLEAATMILTAIKEHIAYSRTRCEADHVTKHLTLKRIPKHSTGIKISGGIRTISQARSYIQLANNIMGEGWVNPGVFRIGASALLKEILEHVN
ncbi:MAG: deoxyribose-phosphate aldolase [Gammaproteobacteria bacterium]|nr:deoxyribose-phosphate aldolase [Gammaproteobacteria bacterium]